MDQAILLGDNAQMIFAGIEFHDPADAGGLSLEE
jgi:hypothetical protein